MSSKINIKELDGTARAVYVNSEELKSMTVEEFRRRFFPEDERELRFIFEGKQLDGGRTFGDYGIKDCCTFHVVQRMRGGGPPPPEDEDEDEDKGMSRTASMDRLASMQQTDPESNRSCCIL